MASRASFTDDSKMIRKTIPKSLLLRDYLRDDMSSCSSNGFRSYPRRQCCTTVRFLVEIDLNKNSKLTPKKKQQRPSVVETKPKSSSVLQRASAVMINAFKHFPFAGARSSRKANFLPRSLSRKLLKHQFWKKTDNNKEIKRLKSFGDLIKEKQTNPPPSPSKFSTAVTTTTMADLTTSMSNSNSDSWSDSDFTTTTDSFTTGNSSDVNTSQNDVVNDSQEEKKKKKKVTNGKRVGATAMTTTYSSTTENEKDKRQNDQVEQFSPVSVMDFPSDNDNDVDGEDEVSSVFQRRHLDVEGTKRSLHKTRRIEGVPQLEPVKLEDRIARLVLESTHACHEFEQENNQAAKKAIALLQLMESTISHRFFNFEAVKSLLFGFFKERMLEENISDYEMLQTAREWMDGHTQELFLDWESQKNRQTYARAMEKGVKWSNYDEKSQINDLGLELEHDVFTSLIDDILLDFH